MDGSGRALKHTADIASSEPDAKRDEYGQVVLHPRLRQALARLDPEVAADVLDEAFRKLTRPVSAGGENQPGLGG